MWRLELVIDCDLLLFLASRADVGDEAIALDDFLFFPTYLAFMHKFRCVAGVCETTAALS